MNERNFSERLKTFRKQKGLTQQQLADLLNISNKSSPVGKARTAIPTLNCCPLSRRHWA